MAELLGKRIKRYHRRGGNDHHDGELWIVSYADMMTLLFGFFVILYSLSNIDNNAFNDVRKELAETFRGDVKELKSQSEVGMMMQNRQIRALQLLVAMLNLGEVNKVVDRIEKEMAEGKSLESARKSVIAGMEKDEDSIISKLKIKMKDKQDRVEIALPSHMLFRSGTADLMPNAKVGIQKIAGYLNRVKGMVGLEVVGHTDSAPPSKGSLYPSNWALSAARAGSVAEELIRSGVSEGLLVTRGMSSLQPLFPERRASGAFIPANMAKNRRVSIVIKKASDVR